MTYPASMAGKSAKCGKCGAVLKLPPLKGASPEPKSQPKSPSKPSSLPSFDDLATLPTDDPFAGISNPYSNVDPPAEEPTPKSSDSTAGGLGDPLPSSQHSGETIDPFGADDPFGIGEAPGGHQDGGSHGSGLSSGSVFDEVQGGALHGSSGSSGSVFDDVLGGDTTGYGGQPSGYGGQPGGYGGQPSGYGGQPSGYGGQPSVGTGQPLLEVPKYQSGSGRTGPSYRRVDPDKLKMAVIGFGIYAGVGMIAACFPVLHIVLIPYFLFCVAATLGHLFCAMTFAMEVHEETGPWIWVALFFCCGPTALFLYVMAAMRDIKRPLTVIWSICVAIAVVMFPISLIASFVSGPR
ncbi:hypothetical protein [Lignipirellula cremea]|uniref:hypothetical protein n=1 Tax=Lignipirellula cremea TaxID=2528010 RepID=UPI0011A79C02|nr:hypothetical protein [Lignipirellula cremea]